MAGRRRICLPVSLAVWVLFCGIGVGAIRTQPGLLSQDGHLVVHSGDGRNISLMTTGAGCVNVNGENLVLIAKMARNASEVVERLRTTTWAAVEQNVQSLLAAVDGPRGLKRRMSALEDGAGNGTGSNAPNRGGGGGGNMAQRMRVTALTRRVFTLERQVRELRALLTANECASNPCRNGGQCQDKYNGFVCLCPDNWKGAMCDEDVNECANFAGTDLGCQNGATCLNKPGTYECTCAVGFFGVHCTRRSNDCASAPSQELCGHGICVSQSGGFTCICEQGWTTNGLIKTCLTDVDECRSSRPPCSRSPPVVCINLPGSFHCAACPPGYTGDGFYCADVDECAIGNGGCSPLVTCINTQGSRVCAACPPGYQGDGTRCAFIGGPCAANNGGCHPSAICRDNSAISASYVSCTCAAGFSGPGIGPTGCWPVAASNPCAGKPCAAGTCTPTGDTTFACACPRGYSGARCEVLENPCASNPCLNSGLCSRNTTDGALYRCYCKPGYQGATCAERQEACGGLRKSDSDSVKYPPGPRGAQYSSRVSCAWVIQVNETKVVNLTFTSFKLEESADCKYDWLQVNDGSSAGELMMGKFCGRREPFNIVSTTHQLYLWFRSDHSIGNDGFEFTWNAIEPKCGGMVLATSHGTISSPGAPGNYPPNRDCYWVVQAQLGKRLQFVFFSLMIQAHENCSQDFLAIHNGPTREEPLLAKFCNTSRPAPLVSAGNNALVHFHSDAAGSAPGFQMSYTVVEGFPGCGGVLTAPRGDIISPRDPTTNKYRTAVDCEWRIQQAVGERIQLTFVSFQLEESRSCSFDFVEIREGEGVEAPLVGKYCGRTVPRVYSSTGNIVRVRFRSDWSLTQEGFHIKYQSICGGDFGEPTGVITSPSYPNNYPDSRTCVYLIAQPPGKAIKLQFLDFEIEDSSYPTCNFDYLLVRDGDNSNSTRIGQYCGGTEKTPPPIVSTHNFLWIQFSTDSFVRNRGFKANYSTIDLECGGILRASHGLISSPRHPETYPHNMRCTWVVVAPAGFVVQLTFVSFSLEYHPACKRDYVQVFDNSTVQGTGGSMGKYCAGTVPPVLTSSDTTMTVVFVTDSSVSRDGFTASYITLDASRMCGGNFYTTTGVLTSPNYPRDYLHDKDCTWVLTVPTGQQIMLNVTKFDMEKHHSCNFDYLEIKNGGYKTSPLVGKFCGKEIPRLIPSLSNQMFIRFVSDTSRSAGGFRIVWDGTATGCGGTLTSPSGSVTSPNYPAPYGRNAECFWRIAVSQGSRIQLTFVDLELENHSKCRLDYLEVRDGLDQAGKLHGKYCGSHPASVISTANQMTLKFRSDVSQEGRGFHLKYDTICNTAVTGNQGVIESPNFPQQYPGSRECTWTIKASKGNKVNITFSHFGTEIADNNSTDLCKYDYLRVTESDHEEPSAADKELGRFCGTDLPPPIASSRDHVFVHFVTDPLVADIGFRLEWVLNGCGGTFDRPTGGFTSPGYPNAYSVSMSCEWLITGAFDQSVRLNISELSIEKGTENCIFDSLEVFNGVDDTGVSLGKFCHTTQSPTVLTSTGNAMFVRFLSDSSFVGKGFKANYTVLASRCGGTMSSARGTVHSLNYPSNYGPNDDCQWLIEVDPSHVIRFQFTDFDVEAHQNCSMDYVRVYDGNSTSAPKLLDHCGSSLPTPAQIVSTGNQMFVHFKSDGSVAAKGFKANYSIACGARLLTDSTGLLSLRDAINAVDTNKNCSWIILAKQPDQRVTLTITHLDVSPSSDVAEGECPYYYVELLDGDSLDAPPIGDKSCGATAPPQVTSSGSALTVHLVARQGGHYGQFEAAYSVLSGACGGALTSENGAFATPGYPRSYPADAECIWTLNASPGNRVQLSFAVFDIANSESCNEDYVEVREGDALGRLVGVYCTDVPSNVTASNKLWIKFRSAAATTMAAATSGSAEAVGGKGFLAYYTLLHGNELTGESGQIASPLYPRAYIQTGDFSWRVTVQFGFAVAITFKDFYIDKMLDTCPYYLGVFDGFDESAPQLMRACGGAIPDAVTSSSNVVYIRLVTDPMRQGTVFLLDWLQVPKAKAPAASSEQQNVTGCGGRIDLAANEGKVLTSPGFPTGYAGKMDCEWIVETRPGHHVAMRMLALELETGATCQYDNVQVYRGRQNQPEWRPLRTLCWANETTDTFHATSLMRIVFHTDLYVNKTGFSATLVSACGGLLTDASGIVEVNNATLGGEVSLPLRQRVVECQWNISAQAGRRINITFTRFDLMDATLGFGCGDNFVMLKNGANQDSPLLGAGKYCGTTLPPSLETTGNRAYIKYRGPREPLKGFRLEYRQVSLSCGGRLTLSLDSNATNVSSPNFPQIPPPHTECEWVVMAPAGRRITLDFVDRFDLTPSYDCSKAAVEVRDGGTQGSRLLGRYCVTLPSSLDSTGNVLYVRFFTDVPDPKNGFKAVVKIASCGGTVRDGRGTITSPGSPGQYPAGLHCVWRVVGYRGHALNLDLQLLDLLRRVDNCTAGDYLRIEEVVPGNDTLVELGTYCKVPRAFVRTSSNEAVITFHSGPSSSSARVTTYSGFRLAFNSSTDSCGGKLETPAGSFQSPGYPAATANRACMWMISVPVGRRVTVTLTDFDLEAPSSSVLSPRLSFYNDFGFLSRIASFNGSSAPKVVQSTSRMMLVSFWTYRATANRGFKATYTSDEPALCGAVLANATSLVIGPPSASLNLTSFFCEWEYSRPAELSQTLALTLSSGSIGKRDVSKCEYSQSKIAFARGDEAALSLVEMCGNYTTPFIVRSPYPITRIKATEGTHHGKVEFVARLSTSPCGGLLTGPEERITSPGFPANYPSDTDCAWAVTFPSGQAIKVNFTRFDVEADDGCSRDYLLVRNGPLPTSPLLGRFCGGDLPASFRSQSNRLWIDFHSDSANQKSGFELTLSPVVDGCGGTFQAAKGEIFSPGFPKRYPASAECEWEVRAQDGYTLQLTFVDRFFIESSQDCAKDFVEVFDWADGGWKSLGRRCGREIQPVFNTTGNQMRIVFRSDNTSSADGFKARWGVKCGGLIEARNRGQLISPGYPLPYASMLNCNYTIVAPAQYISVRFDAFNLEEGPKDCRYDNVTLFGLVNAWSKTPTALGTYCGTNTPPPRVFKNFVTLVFRTDQYLERKGFRMHYELNSCGGDVTAPAQITSPVEDSGFLGPLNCTWVITAPPNKVVVLRFSRLELEHSYKCHYDAVSVFDGPRVDPKRLVGEFCGNQSVAPPVAKSTSNQMVVQLRMAHHRLKYAFAAAVVFTYGEKAGCGGSMNVTNTATALRSPDANNDGHYERFLDCHWLLLAPVGQTVNLELSTLDLAPCKGNATDPCACDYLEVRDGPSQYADLIGRFCRLTDTPPLRASGNSMWIRFVSDEAGERSGFRATATAQESVCGALQLNVTNTPQELTSPGWPNAYPANLRCRWTLYGGDSSRFQLHFVTLDLDDAAGCKDNLVLTDLGRQPIISQGLGQPSVLQFGQMDRPISVFRGSRNPTAPTRFCGRPASLLDYYSETSNVAVTFTTDQENAAKGFKLIYSKAGCTRNYTGAQGRILVERLPAHCYITITAAPNNTIALYMANFQMIGMAGCESKALEVRDGGPGGNVLAKLCSYDFPRAIFSTGSSLYLHAWRNEGADFENFDITYTTTDKGRGCGGQLFNYGGVFTSQMYPMNFRNASVCRWDVTVPFGTLPVLKFQEFDIGPKSSCATDFVELIDVDESGTEFVRTTYCGQDRPAVYMGATGTVAVRYTTSVHNGGTGWLIKFMGRLPGATISHF